MQFMCLIYSAPNSGPKPGTPEFGMFMKGYGDFTQTVKADGKFVAGDALQGADTRQPCLCVQVKRKQLMVRSRKRRNNWAVITC